VRDLTAMREEYQGRGLDRADLADDPVEQFHRWFEEWAATDPFDTSAMVLATADADGRPSARYVLLRSADARGFAFFTNLGSRKGAELTINPRAALCFGWLGQARQIRIEGTVEPVDPAEADAYFAARPLGSRLGAWASDQSQVIADRSVLDERVHRLEQQFGDDVPRPPNWGGFRVVPDEFEFWQGRASRLHDRFRYRRDPTRPDTWLIDRLSP
jgi:pyridoxamine 5'-phosphate oxidase